MKAGKNSASLYVFRVWENREACEWRYSYSELDLKTRRVIEYWKDQDGHIMRVFR